MPRILIFLLLVVVTLTLVPLGFIYRARHSPKSEPRIQVVYDMDNQFSFKAQEGNLFFSDGRAMRFHPAGTVARGHAADDDAFFRGRVADDTIFTEVFPVQVDDGLMRRGEERFRIYCAPCHGVAGDGSGLVSVRAQALAEGTWTSPTDLASRSVIDRPVGHIFNTITNGIRNMPAHGSQIGVRDRWAIVAYVRALQLARNATFEDLPPAVRAQLVD